MSDSLTATEALPAELLACVRALDDKKADRMTLLNLKGISSVADYFVIATGTSDPHLKALASTLEATLKEHNAEVFGSQTDSKTGWVVVDAYDTIYHLFTQEQRSYYNLEGLWKDASAIDLETLGLTS